MDIFQFIQPIASVFGSSAAATSTHCFTDRVGYRISGQAYKRFDQSVDGKGVFPDVTTKMQQSMPCTRTVAILVLAAGLAAAA